MYGEVQQRMDLMGWPEHLAQLHGLYACLAQSTRNLVDRWTHQKCYVLCREGWLPEDEAGELPEDEEDDRSRQWRGSYVSWCWCPVQGAGGRDGGFLKDRRGIQRTPVLRALVSLALALGHLSWVEDRTGPATE